MYPYPRPPSQPNYAMRRLVAGGGVLFVVLILFVVVRSLSGGGDETVESPTSAAPTSSTIPIQEPPDCAIPTEAEPTIFAREQDWFRTLLDTTYALPDLYEPPDLVSAAEAGYSRDFRIRAFVAPDLDRVRNAILREGLPEVALAAAYRSVEDQASLFDRRVTELGFQAAAAGTARPGHSEHHLGTAIDVRPIGAKDVDESFGDSDTGRWLASNSWRYGFILSYPAGAQDVTCYKYEPWHFRYVGPDLARRIHDSGLTLREYLWHWEVTGAEPGVSPTAGTQPALPTSTLPDAEG